MKVGTTVTLNFWTRTEEVSALRDSNWMEGAAEGRAEITADI